MKNTIIRRGAKLEADRKGDRPKRRITIRDGFHALIVLCTWVLFFYWWYCVLPLMRLSDAAWAGFTILAVSLGTVVVTLGWVRYNLGIFRRKGPRLTNPDILERFTIDTLGRELVHSGWEELRASRLITVTVDGEDRKTFSARED
ncbi:hypothetical protein [Candidatus Deferrimicrobium sp.]|uniref:hypothetical protein n=1 Tax=Candidatus Deferrimicrobium sp. TaxID=3060586 RepID=UPI003C6447AF